MDSTTGNPLVRLFRAAWRYSAGNRFQVVCYGLMFVGADCLWLFVPPFVWTTLLSTVQSGVMTLTNVQKVWCLLGVIFIVDVLFWALHGPARYLERKNAFKVRRNYRWNLLDGVLRLPLEWHSEHHSGDTIDKIEKGTTALHEFSKGTFEIINSAIQLVGSYAVLAYFSPPAALIVALMILVSMWITMRFDRVLVAQYREINHAENAISESIFDVVSNITTVIILRVEKVVFDSIMRKVELPYRLMMRNSALGETKWFLTNMCCTVMTVAVLGIYCWQHEGMAGPLLFGSVFLLYQYLDKMSNLFFRFTTMYGDMLIHHARVGNAEELSADFKPGSLANHVLPPKWRELSIVGLDFSYTNGGSTLNLDDVSLSLKRGEHIAFVGETGSGKTTLLKVIRDLYHPQKLALSVDGKPIVQGFEGISRAIALIPQDPEIFTSTILENITLGADYDPAFVRRFTDMACFSEVIAELPNGLDSSIKEKGVNLSGGQQQRLALARGLLASHDKSIVLFDEPTSSLDALTEMRVYQNIFREFTGKTLISSIHRLHLLPLFDRICVFDRGKIIATGTLDELLDSCPTFKALWDAVKNLGSQE